MSLNFEVLDLSQVVFAGKGKRRDPRIVEALEAAGSLTGSVLAENTAKGFLLPPVFDRALLTALRSAVSAQNKQSPYVRLSVRSLTGRFAGRFALTCEPVSAENRDEQDDVEEVA